MDEQPADEGIPPALRHQTLGLLSRESIVGCVYVCVCVELVFIWTLFVFNCAQSERDGFATFHVYVCAALLAKFSPNIKAAKDFQVRRRLEV